MAKIDFRKLAQNLQATEFVEHEPIRIKKIDVIVREMELVMPFETSFGRYKNLTKYFIKIDFVSKNKTVSGLGESPTLPDAVYDGEFSEGVRAAINTQVVPALLKEKDKTIKNVNDFIAPYSTVVNNNMAKVGVEGAYWDAIGKLLKKPVWQLWGGRRNSLAVGTSVGLESDPAMVLKKIEKAVANGIKRIKIKIKPGRDIQYVKAIREKFPRLLLQVDGNAAYDLFNPDHIKALKELNEYDLLMIEQPGPNKDIVFHYELSKKIATPVCLDESLIDLSDLLAAIKLWSDGNILDRLIVNIKPPRVGGWRNAILFAKACGLVGIKCWCGGMLESALGKISNLHFNSLMEVNLPGDHVAQGRYYVEDVVKAPALNGGKIIIPSEPGWGLKNIKI